MSFRNILQGISKHGRFIVFVFIFGVGILIIWFMVSGFDQGELQISIGLAAISTYLAAVSSIANLLQAVETERQRRNQERPYINTYFDPSGGGMIYFIVENLGNSPAKKISIEINPIPKDHAGRKLSDVSFFSKPIGFLPAGKKLRQMVDIGYNFLRDGSWSRL